MNIQLNKDDLFRHAMPGYAFLMVVLSFYLLDGELVITWNTAQIILALALAFPLGFFIHNVYRFLHAVVPLSFSLSKGFVLIPEQRRMEADEARMILDRLPKPLEKKLELDADDRLKNRELSQLLELYLNADKNGSFKGRDSFLIMRVHSLSGLIVAIVFALCMIVFLKTTTWDLLSLNKFLGISYLLSTKSYWLGAFWAIIAIGFSCVRYANSEAYDLLMRRIVISFWSDFEEFISKYI